MVQTESPTEMDELTRVLGTLDIKAECRAFRQVRNISTYDVVLADGARLRDIERCAHDIGLRLRARALPMVRPIMSEGVVRIQVVSREPEPIPFRAGLQREAGPLGVMPFYLGETVDDTPLWLDFHQNPHLLVAGASGSGKSTLLHTIVANALRHPNLNLFLFDTKGVEFAPYSRLNRGDVRIDTTYAGAATQLRWIQEIWMPFVYETMRESDLPADYFARPECELPYTLVVVDEFADLIMQDDDHSLYDSVCRIAQKGRAAGIHLVVATQRPSVEILKGTIKANFPARIACHVSSRTDSMVILDSPHAHSLFGRGDALVRAGEHDLLRFQVAYATAESNVQDALEAPALR